MNYLFVFISFLALTLNAHCQAPNLDDWTGHYEGVLFIDGPQGSIDSLPIHLDFHQLDSNRWSQKYSFFSEKYGDIVKDYEIFWSDTLKEKNHFVLDEKDGILIDEVLINNTFYAQYSVMGNNFQTILRKEAGGLYYEIICSSPEKGIKSKSEKDEEGNEYEVESSFVFTIQYAKLYR